MKLITLAFALVLSQACMKQTIGGLGLGWDEEHPQTQACAQNVIDSYRTNRQSNSDPTLKQQYEITFDCSMGDEP